MSLHHIWEWQPPAVGAARTPEKSVKPQARDGTMPKTSATLMCHFGPTGKSEHLRITRPRTIKLHFTVKGLQPGKEK